MAARGFTPSRRWRGHGAFTLVEILVATAITLAMLALFFKMLSSSTDQWKRTNDGVRTFADARLAFDTIIRCLSMATLNPVYDYYDANRVALGSVTLDSQAGYNFQPDTYGRFSNLHFIADRNILPGEPSKSRGLITPQVSGAVFFQAPLDFTGDKTVSPTSGRLNAIGFFVAKGSDALWLAPNLRDKFKRDRLRLYGYLQPTDELDIYLRKTGNLWFTTYLNKTITEKVSLPNTYILAENVVAFVIVPDVSQVDQAQTADGRATSYLYDSRVTWPQGKPQPVTMHQLPPTVRVLMVVVDEATVLRYPTVGYGTNLGPNHDINTNFSTFFDTPATYTDDLEKVTSALDKLKAGYRVFQADVRIQAAQWSE